MASSFCTIPGRRQCSTLSISLRNGTCVQNRELHGDSWPLALFKKPFHMSMLHLKRRNEFDLSQQKRPSRVQHGDNEFWTVLHPSLPCPTHMDARLCLVKSKKDALRVSPCKLCIAKEEIPNQAKS